MDISYAYELALGRGYNPQNGVSKGTAVSYGSKSPSKAMGGQVDYSLTLLEDTQSIDSGFGMDLGARVRGIAYQVDGKFSLHNSHSRSSYSVSLVCRITVRNAVTHLTEVAMLPDLAKLWQDDPDHFINSYGTDYLGSELTGGEYLGRIEIQTNCASDQQALSAKLSGGTRMFSGSAEFQQQMEAITSSRNTSVWVQRYGGIGGSLETTLDEMMRRVKGFEKEVTGENIVHACPIGYISYPYTNLGLPPLRLQDAMDHRSYLLDQLATAYEEAMLLGSDIAYILRLRDEFAKSDVAALASVRKRTTKLISDIKRTMSQIRSARLADVFQFTDPVLNLPDALALRSELPERFSHYTKRQSVLARNPGWTDTDAFVFSGQHVNFTALGEWNCGKPCDAWGLSPVGDPPNGAMLAPGLPFGALVGRIGDQTFLVGAQQVVRAERGGTILLACNDSSIGVGWADNSNSLDVEIKVGSGVGPSVRR